MAEYQKESLTNKLCKKISTNKWQLKNINCKPSFQKMTTRSFQKKMSLLKINFQLISILLIKCQYPIWKIQIDKIKQIMNDLILIQAQFI